MRQRRILNKTLSLLAVILATALLIHGDEASAQQRGTGVLMAEDILDMDIRTTAGENIGEIEDVLFDRSGKIRGFIVEVGGFLDIGDKEVEISTRELRFNPDRGYAVYRGTRSELENKPDVDEYGYRYGRGYYPYRPYYGYGYGSPYYAPYYGRYSPPYGDRRYPPRGYYGREFGRDMEQERESQTRRDPARRQMEDNARYSQREGRNLWMENLVDADVRNPYGKPIGDIEDLVVDRNGRITHAIVEVGGFLGIGAKEVAVAFDELEDIGSYFVIYPGSEEQLRAMPQFDRGRFLGEASGWAGTLRGEDRQNGGEARRQAR